MGSSIKYEWKSLYSNLRIFQLIAYANARFCMTRTSLFFATYYMDGSNINQQNICYKK